MSVYIKDMEMPKLCGECRFCVDGWCYVIPEFERQPSGINRAEITQWCPLIPVPSHGRLIDADALKEWIEDWFQMNRHYHPYAKSNNIPITELYDILERIPTIIPSDKDGAE